MNSELPPDPFLDDPYDPAGLLEPDEEFPPLTPEEKEQVREDLQAALSFRMALAPRGVLGIVMVCEDCEAEHFYDWDIMIANMRATLAGEPAPVHEPGCAPDASKYVTWDYCFGYMDGLAGR